MSHWKTNKCPIFNLANRQRYRRVTPEKITSYIILKYSYYLNVTASIVLTDEKSRSSNLTDSDDDDEIFP